MKNPFTEHPHSIGETYLGHALAASRICVRLGIAATAAGIHAVLPFVFVTTTRRMVNEMSDEFNSGRRTRLRGRSAQPSPQSRSFRLDRAPSRSSQAAP